MFGHKSLPTRIYSYGARRPSYNGDVADQAMKLALDYRNRLAAIECERRLANEAALAKHAPHLKLLNEKRDSIGALLLVKRDELKQKRAALKKRVPDRVLSNEIMQLLKDHKAVRKHAAEARKVAFTFPKMKEELININLTYTAHKKAARASSGLYWGTYVAVEMAMSGVRKQAAPPQPLRFDGRGRLCVQIQNGAIPAKLYENKGPIRITKVEGGPKRLHLLQMRISGKGKQQLFAKIPFFLHRPLPADSLVKWCYLIRRRIATTYYYKVQFVLARESGWAKPAAASGSVGVDIGFRRVPEGIRVAYYSGSDGEAQPLIIPYGQIQADEKVRDLQSIRKKNFNEILLRVRNWLTDASPPDWLADRTETIGQWKSEGRMASLAIFWRENRFENDIFDEVEAWRKQDKHLYLWQGHLRAKINLRRQQQYRDFAAMLRKHYGTVMLEDLSLAEMAKNPMPEEDAKDGALKYHMRLAALSYLRDALRQSGMAVVERVTKNSTRTCSWCGFLNRWIDQSLLIQMCAGCKRQWDQDWNAARNLQVGVQEEQRKAA